MQSTMHRKGAVSLMAVLLFAASLDAAEPVRRALLVGINVYQWSGAVHKDAAQDFPNLAGATGDAIWLKSILTSKYGFRDEDVVVLTDAAATRDAILNTFRSHLIAKSAAGDVALFYYAGHGSTRHAGADREETLVPTDSRDPEGKVFDIGSSDLHLLFADLVARTKNVTSILDSCHSDTTVRSVELKRSIRADSRVLKSAPRRVELAATTPITAAVRISASRADQESEEYTEFTADGKSVQHGLMSYELFHELEAAGDQASWRDVMDRTRTEVAKRNASQEPQLEAPSDDTRLFGGVGLAAKEPFLLVTPARQKVQLNAGAMLGLAKETLLDVYPPGTRDFAGLALAKLRVTEVADFTSDAVVVSGVAAREIPEGARAVVRNRPLSSFRFRIFFEGNHPLVAAIQKSCLDTVVGAVVSPQRSSANVVVRFGDGAVHTEKPDGFVLSPEVLAAEDGAADHVVRQLAAWSRWNQLLMLEGGAPVLQLNVTNEKGASVVLVPDGTTITVELCNNGTKPSFTRVVYFSSDGAVTPLDLDTDGAALAPKQCKTGRSFVITVEPGKGSAVEFLKAFATADKIDMEPFTAPGIRGDMPDPSVWSAVTKSITVVRR